MAKQQSKLKKLPVNKTVVFCSPLEGEDVLVRTGTIEEGSSFFHALLHAYSKEYASMSNKERMKFVRKLRASMAGKIDRESWENLGKGLIAIVPFQDNLNNILVNFYRFMNDDNKARGASTKRVIKGLIGENGQNFDLYKLLTELIPIDAFQSIILPSAFTKRDKVKISTCANLIVEDTLLYLSKKDEIKSIPSDKASYICSVTTKFISTILDEAKESAYKEYLRGLQTIGEEVDSYTIDFVSTRFNRDIYLLNGNDRLPYKNSYTVNSLEQRKSIVVLWIDKNHYEVVGRLLPGNRVQREFDCDDPIIEKLYNFLVNPDSISDKFPELGKYLANDDSSDTSSVVSDVSDEDSDEYSESDSNANRCSDDSSVSSCSTNTTNTTNTTSTANSNEVSNEVSDDTDQNEK